MRLLPFQQYFSGEWQNLSWHEFYMEQILEFDKASPL